MTERFVADQAKVQPIEKKKVTNLDVLNEAYAYEKPSSFSRALRLELGDVVVLLISGTAWA